MGTLTRLGLIVVVLVVPVDARQLLNAREVANEIQVAPAARESVKKFFPSFRDYQDLMLFHPNFGYYSAGFVSFTADWSTGPNALAPYFGRMVTEQIFRMWQGMRQAGSLSPRDRFTIAEFGAGNGALAESILEYTGQQAQGNPDRQWREFARQMFYACYDRSTVLGAAQRLRNARFGERFEAREADAANPTATIARDSLKGVILSNEMLDNFSVHKVILSADGMAEVAFVVPSLSLEVWSAFSKLLPAQVRELVEQDDRSIKSELSLSKEGATRYLSRGALVAVLESLIAQPDYSANAGRIRFQEVYLPAGSVPDLAEHLSRYARSYACQLAKAGQGVVAYISLGAAKYIQGAGRILKAGYVMTIDYGAGWDGLTVFGPYGKLRSYGPGSVKEKPDPYRWPSMNDITTDVNFGHLAAEGQPAGLRTVYFGFQWALQSGTSVSLGALPRDRQLSERERREFEAWAMYFQTFRAFKLLVQQKRNTDPTYEYPDHDPLPAEAIEGELSKVQRQRADEIANALMRAKTVWRPEARL